MSWTTLLTVYLLPFTKNRKNNSTNMIEANGTQIFYYLRRSVPKEGQNSKAIQTMGANSTIAENLVITMYSTVRAKTGKMDAPINNKMNII